MTTYRLIFGIVTATLAGMLLCAPASARKARHHRKAPTIPADVSPYAEARQPFSFYPENIEGGVPGNLPFNNQIRKMKDPLNANGAGR